MKTGIELIAEERHRQLEKCGWSLEHDDSHTTGELTEAAQCYACVAEAQIRGSGREEWPVEMFDGFHDSLLQWPWEDDDYDPSEYALRNLVKAGALIAAEIDRLNRTTR